jgi:SAM-dependent methyltransferase
MLPRSSAQEIEHRTRKRLREIALIVERMTTYLGAGAGAPIRILEFGSGNGFQLPQLATLGEVVGCDLQRSDAAARPSAARFVQCNVAHAPFRDEEFDVVFSNHVIEHLDDRAGAFREIQRIGRRSCLYAFSVPTSTWLLLTIPAQYYNRFRSATGAARLVRSLGAPGGHGVSTSFRDCYRSFRIDSWRRLFTDHGFSVIETTPLLLYGPSEWPIVPTIRSRGHLCSSVLFLMRKQ